jgi:hypothetical protein
MKDGCFFCGDPLPSHSGGVCDQCASTEYSHHVEWARETVRLRKENAALKDEIETRRNAKTPEPKLDIDVPCPRCRGTGRIPFRQLNSPDEPKTFWAIWLLCEDKTWRPERCAVLFTKAGVHLNLPLMAGDESYSYKRPIGHAITDGDGAIRCPQPIQHFFYTAVVDEPNEYQAQQYRIAAPGATLKE